MFSIFFSFFFFFDNHLIILDVQGAAKTDLPTSILIKYNSEIFDVAALKKESSFPIKERMKREELHLCHVSLCNSNGHTNTCHTL